MTPGQRGGTPGPGGRSACRVRGTAPATSGCSRVFAGAGTSRPRCARGTARRPRGRGFPMASSPRSGSGRASAAHPRSPRDVGAGREGLPGSAGAGRAGLVPRVLGPPRVTPAGVLSCPAGAGPRSNRQLGHVYAPPAFPTSVLLLSVRDGFNSEKGSGASSAHGFRVHGIRHPNNPSL